MKCPRCGSEMYLDTHRKTPFNMCAECGYIEGTRFDADSPAVTNFEIMKQLDASELGKFIAQGMGLKGDDVVAWLNKPMD